MKKQILALTLCLALTATSALAEGTKTVAKKSTTPVAITAVKPATKAVSTATPAALQLTPQEDARKKFEDRKAQERALMYEALKFTNEQKVKAEELDAKTRAEASKYLGKVQIEARKLRELKSKHASVFFIYKQKMILKSAKSDARKFFAASRKSFEAILTKEQKAKFKVMQEARQKEMDAFRKNHKTHNHNGIGPKGQHGHHGQPPMVPPPPGKGVNVPHGPQPPMGPPPAEKK